MRKILFLFFILFSLLPVVISAEYMFMHFLENDVVRGIALEDNFIWCATDSGVVRFDKNTGNSVRYTMGDGLSSNEVLCVAIDHNGVKWFGSINKGVSWFDGSKWDSIQPPNWERFPTVTTIAVDSNNTKWFLLTPGLASFNGERWSNVIQSGGFNMTVDSQNRVWVVSDEKAYVYNPADSTWQSVGEIGSWTFTAVAEDKNHVMWFGADQGVESFDGENTVIYEMMNFIPDLIRAITVDKNNVKWFGTESELWSFDGKTWKIYYNNNSFCPERIFDVAVDVDGTIWTAGQYGLASFHPDSLTSVKESLSPAEFRVTGIYPNPFNPSTTISFTLPSAASATLTVYDITGRKVRTLVSSHLSAGNHSATWDGKDPAGRSVSSGVYIARLESGKSAQSMKMLLMR